MSMSMSSMLMLSISMFDALDMRSMYLRIYSNNKLNSKYK